MKSGFFSRIPMNGSTGGSGIVGALQKLYG